MQAQQPVPGPQLLDQLLEDCQADHGWDRPRRCLGTSAHVGGFGAVDGASAVERPNRFPSAEAGSCWRRFPWSAKWSGRRWRLRRGGRDAGRLRIPGRRAI